MKLIGIYNIKGGVGKTTSAVNMAWLSTQLGGRTLLWDLDPQGAASFYFRVQPKIKGGTRKLLKGKKTLLDVVCETDFPGLDLVPADLSYRNFDLALNKAKKPGTILRKLLKPVAGDYDYVFLDCPPSFSVLSENVFRAADAVVVPMIPTTLSVRTYAQLIGFLNANQMESVPLVPFFTMVDRRKRMHTTILEELPKRRPEFLRSFVPYASVVERMGTERTPLHLYAQSSPAAIAYADLWQDLTRRLA